MDFSALIDRFQEQSLFLQVIELGAMFLVPVATTALSGLAGFLEKERTKLRLRLAGAKSNTPTWLYTLVTGSFEALKDLEVTEAEVSDLFDKLVADLTKKAS